MVKKQCFPSLLLLVLVQHAVEGNKDKTTGKFSSKEKIFPNMLVEWGAIWVWGYKLFELIQNGNAKWEGGLGLRTGKLLRNWLD